MHILRYSWSVTAGGGSGVDGVGAPVMSGLEGGYDEMRHVEAEMMVSWHRCFRPGEASTCGWRSTELRKNSEEVSAGCALLREKERVQEEASGTFVVAGIDFERQIGRAHV